MPGQILFSDSNYHSSNQQQIEQHHHHQPKQHQNQHQLHQIQQQQQQQQQQHHLQQQQQQQHSLQQINYSPQLRNQQIYNQQDNRLIGYYFGSISRNTAEWILLNRGNNLDGAYLLRSSGQNDDFVLSLLVVSNAFPSDDQNHQTSLVSMSHNQSCDLQTRSEVLHYKIIETDDSFVALHGQIGNEKFSTIDELIEKSQGVATKPRWPILRTTVEHQILPPTFWGLTVDQVRLAILLKAKQWGFPLLSSVFQQSQQYSNICDASTETIQRDSINMNTCPSNIKSNANITNTLNNETIRTLIYKSLHEFQPWFHGKISREEAERRIEQKQSKDGHFLVRESDNFTYGLSISHKKIVQHYRIHVLPTGELAIRDGRKFTSLMALVSHYTIMSDGLWCALTEPCIRPITNINIATKFQPLSNISTTNNNINNNNNLVNRIDPQSIVGLSDNMIANQNNQLNHSNIYQTRPNTCVNMLAKNGQAAKLYFQANKGHNLMQLQQQQSLLNNQDEHICNRNSTSNKLNSSNSQVQHGSLTMSMRGPLKEWLQTINNKWSQLINSKTEGQQSVNSFLFGNQNPLNHHCRHRKRHHHQNHMGTNRKCKTCESSNRPSTNTKRNTPNHGVVQNINSINQFPPVAYYPVDYQSKIAGLYGCSCEAISSNNSSCPGLNMKQISCINSLNCQNFNSFANDPNKFKSLPVPIQMDQSFIGSPLFSVQSNNQAPLPSDQMVRTRSDSHGSGSGSGHGSGQQNHNLIDANNNNNNNSSNWKIVDQRLISPAQSIDSEKIETIKLTNRQQLSNDHYGSQSSTILLQDGPMAHSSTSSSSGHVSISGPRHQISLEANKTMNLIQDLKLHHRKMNAETINEPAPTIISDMTSATRTKHIGPSNKPSIMCGQHAGPAYRYSNCPNDENCLKFCTHNLNNGSTVPMRRYNPSFEAVDDSHLPRQDPNLIGPVAMSKFVQFQDGHCLRTHRDARSIQLAYLSALNASNSNATRLRNSFNHQQGPINHLKGSNQAIGKSQVITSNSQYQQPNLSFNPQTNNHSKTQNIAPELRQLSGPQKNSSNDTNKKHELRLNEDIDLIDCDADPNFEFKYDPKLIKSSSIETLCSIGETGQKYIEDSPIDLDSFKNNSELIKSLQTYWLPNNCVESSTQRDDILFPTLVSTVESNARLQTHDQVCNQETPATLGLESTAPGWKETHIELTSKTHDLDEITTALLSSLTASLKAQVDLKNRVTSGVHDTNNNNNNMEQQGAQMNIQDTQTKRNQIDSNVHLRDTNNHIYNPTELIDEFDTLAHDK